MPAVPPPQRGFTLIELLIVIGILGTLAVVLVPQIFSVSESAKESATEADMLMLETGVNQFVRTYGIAPSDDLKPPDERIKATWKPDNGRNTGIESLVCFLALSVRDGLDLAPLAERLVNGDKDDHGVEQPTLRSRERYEIADHWQTPLVYFAKSGMQRAQLVQAEPDADAVQVKPKRRPDGVAYGAGKFQLLSAGRDRTFGTDDDLVWPAN